MKAKLLAFAVAAAFALPVAAQQPPQRTERPPADTPTGTSMTLKSLDANKDGYVSRDEAKSSSQLERGFKDLDKDGDGKLSAQELSGQSSPGGMGSSSPAK